MTTFGLIHGGCHRASCWAALQPELERRGHRSLTADLPVDDPAAGQEAYADAAARAFADAAAGEPVVVVGHSLGGAAALALEERLPLAGIVLLCAAVLYPPEVAPDAPQPVLTLPIEALAPSADGLITLADDVATAAFYQDCPPDVVRRALADLRPQAIAGLAGPAAVRPPVVPSVYLRAEEDAAVSAAWSAWAAETLTGSPPVDLPGGHSPFLSRPALLAERLDLVATQMAGVS